MVYLSSGLSCLCISSSSGGLASILSSLVGTATVCQGITNELRDDIDVLSRTVVE